MAMEATCFHRCSPKVTTEPAAGGDAETMEPSREITMKITMNPIELFCQLILESHISHMDIG